MANRYSLFLKVCCGATFWTAIASYGPVQAADREALDRKVQPVINEVGKVCRDKTVYLIGPEKAKRLAELVRQKKPQLVVECGTAIGYSGLWIARELKAAESGKLITIEIDEDRAKQAQANFDKAGLADVVDVQIGDARQLTSKIHGPVDFLFIDCNYSNCHPCFRGIEEQLAPDLAEALLGLTAESRIHLAEATNEGLLEVTPVNLPVDPPGDCNHCGWPIATMVGDTIIVMHRRIPGHNPRGAGRPHEKMCAKQDRPQPIWNAVVETGPQLFVFLGDNIYGDTEDMDLLRAKYQLLGNQPGYRKLKAACPILATWDDHDYGVNDSGSEYPKKRESQQVFLDFFDVPQDDIRRTRDGIYSAHVSGPEGRRVQIILLDTRYFRSPLKAGYQPGETGEGDRGIYVPNTDEDATMLGEAQWSWLEEQLKVPAELRFIGSSVQVIADEHGWEKWQLPARTRTAVVVDSQDTGSRRRFSQRRSAFGREELSRAGVFSFSGG